MGKKTSKRGGGPLDETPRTMEALRAWLVRWLDVTVPSAVLPLEESGLVRTAPMAYLWHAFDEEADGPRDCVVWASRGGGKTFLGAVATVLDMVFKPGIEVRVLGGSLEQSRRMHGYVRGLLETPWLAEMVEGKVSEKRVRLVNGSGVEILAASQTSIRGTRVQKVRCDEVELFDLELWNAVQLTTRSKTVVRPDGTKIKVRGAIEALSTMHVPFGLMSTLVRESAGERADPDLRTPSGAQVRRPGVRKVFRWGTLDVLEKCGEAHVCGEGSGEPCLLWPECRGRAKLKTEKQAGHVSVEDALVMKGRVDVAAWASEMLCLKPRRSDCVYQEFDEAVHVIDHEPWREAGAEEKGAWVAGMDFGFRAPTVAVLAWVVGEGDEMKVMIVDEHAAVRTKLDDHLRMMREKEWPILPKTVFDLNGTSIGIPEGGRDFCPRPTQDSFSQDSLTQDRFIQDSAPQGNSSTLRWIGIDPAGEAGHEQTGSSNAAILRRAGLRIRAKRLPVREGIGRVRALLVPADGKGPRLVVHRRCVGLIQALTRYHYPSDKPGSLEPAKDGPDHACDALRYLVVNMGREEGNMRGY